MKYEQMFATVIPSTAVDAYEYLQRYLVVKWFIYSSYALRGI
jgi:hypothetical protein